MLKLLLFILTPDPNKYLLLALLKDAEPEPLIKIEELYPTEL